MSKAERPRHQVLARKEQHLLAMARARRKQRRKVRPGPACMNTFRVLHLRSAIWLRATLQTLPDMPLVPLYADLRHWQVMVVAMETMHRQRISRRQGQMLWWRRILRTLQLLGVRHQLTQP